MDTKMDGGRAVALSGVANTSRISTRSTRKRKTALVTPKKCIEFIVSKHPSKSFESGIAELFKESYLESPTFRSYFSPANKDKNVSKTTWLYDSTRVVIPDVDYYHASYIDGMRSNQYILAQAPFNSQMQKDFYKMLQHVKAEAVLIVDGCEDILTYLLNKKEMEKGGTVTMETTTDDITVMKLKEKGLNMKFVRMNRWDNKLPSESEMVDMYERVRKSIGWNQKGPLVVVCKDGAMKSGVFVLLDIEGERLKEKGKVKLSDTLKAIRFARSNTFDTQDIFEFSCACIVELCRRHKK